MAAYPPQPANYQPSQQQGATVVVTGQPAPMIVQHLGECPARTTCPSCGAEILTSVYFQTGTLTWVACIVLALIGLWVGCCLIPFCLDFCKDIIHTCPNCHYTIGRKNRI